MPSYGGREREREREIEGDRGRGREESGERKEETQCGWCSGWFVSWGGGGGRRRAVPRSFVAHHICVCWGGGGEPIVPASFFCPLPLCRVGSQHERRTGLRWRGGGCCQNLCLAGAAARRGNGCNERASVAGLQWVEGGEGKQLRQRTWTAQIEVQQRRSTRVEGGVGGCGPKPKCFEERERERECVCVWVRVCERKTFSGVSSRSPAFAACRVSFRPAACSKHPA